MTRETFPPVKARAISFPFYLHVKFINKERLYKTKTQYPSAKSYGLL